MNTICLNIKLSCSILVLLKTRIFENTDYADFCFICNLTFLFMRFLARLLAYSLRHITSSFWYFRQQSYIWPASQSNLLSLIQFHNILLVHHLFYNSAFYLCKNASLRFKKSGLTKLQAHTGIQKAIILSQSSLQLNNIGKSPRYRSTDLQELDPACFTLQQVLPNRIHGAI